MTRHQFARLSNLPLKQDCLWQIETGIVRTLTWLEDGRIVTLGLWGPGDVVGKILSKTNPYQIECLSQVQATILLPDQWDRAKEALLEHIQQAEELMVIRSHKRVDDMLLVTLSWLAKKFGRQIDTGHLIDLRLTHQELANLLGISRVTITRCLAKFEQQGLINRLSRKLIILKEIEFWHYEI